MERRKQNRTNLEVFLWRTERKKFGNAGDINYSERKKNFGGATFLLKTNVTITFLNYPQQSN